MPKTGNHVIHSQFVIDEDCCFDKFYMTKNRIVAITEVVRLEQLKLSQGSEKIRLHYLFKGCSEVVEPFILTSNWIEL